jgi:hypothetical protein
VSWCWEGGPQWFEIKERPVPPWEFAVAAHFRQRCPRCVRRELRVVSQTFTNGTKHLRCACALCGKFLAHLKAPPGTDVVFKARATKEGEGEGGGEATVPA